jgi:hypothetical protein
MQQDPKRLYYLDEKSRVKKTQNMDAIDRNRKQGASYASLLA